MTVFSILSPISARILNGKVEKCKLLNHYKYLWVCDLKINKVSGIYAQLPVDDTLVYAAFLKT